MMKPWLLIRFGLAVIFGLILFSSVGAVMRESDQASLLDGAIQLARDGKLVRDGFYNYSVQFGSYWILALCFVLSGSHEIEATPEQAVLLGNLISCLVFVGGVALLLITRGPRNPFEFILVLSFLFSPMVLLNGPLLSTNLLSAGFLCGLVFFLSGRVSRWRDFFVAIFGFAAVAARGDAVLIFPFLCLLSLTEKNWWKFLSVPRLWILAGVSIFTLLLGRSLAGRGQDSYAAYFIPKVAITYFVFGLGSLSLLFPLLVGWLSAVGIARKRWLMILVSLAMLLPLGFYCRVLMTPRHLMMTALVPFFFLCFPQGRSWVEELIGGSWRLLLVVVFTIGSALPLVFGIQLSSLKSGRLVLSDPTLYPTADGYWPMGCYAQFLTWLRVAEEEPIDHNQRVWQAWKALAAVPKVPEGVRLRSKGLISLGLLRATQLGQRECLSGRHGEFSLMTTRYFSKSNAHDFSGKPLNVRSLNNKGVCLASGAWDDVILQFDGGKVLEGREGVGPFLSQYGNGDDFVLGNESASWSSLRGAGPFRWLFFSKMDESGERVVRDEILGREGWKSAKENEYWMARSALPSFFTIENYGQRK